MRVAVAVVLIVSGIVPHAAADQGGACALLTKDLLVAHTAIPKENLARMLKIPPEEEKIAGSGGTMCSYGDVIFQLDPFAAGNFDKLFSQWTAVSGVGDRAYFRDNRGMFAEIAAISGKRVITIQMDVPTGGTPASIQPNVVGLAKAILGKLK
jgi:hypothetical protein